MNNDNTACLHPCEFPHCVEKCRQTTNEDHQYHRCDRHRVIPKAFSQHVRPTEATSVSEVVNETFVSADKNVRHSRNIVPYLICTSS